MCIKPRDYIGKLVKTNYSGGPDVGSYLSPALCNYRLSSKDSLSITKISSVFYGANIDGNSIFICPVKSNRTLDFCSTTGEITMLLSIVDWRLTMIIYM